MTLQVYGAHRVMENAPVEVAVDAMSGGARQMQDGYIAHLVGGEDLRRPGATVPAVADVAMNADTQILRYSVARPDMRLLFTVTRGYYEILGRRSRGVRVPADLRGKRIGTFARTSSEYYLHGELAHYGIGIDEVEVVPLMPELAVSQALIEGEVDAITIWEPATQHAKEGVGADCVSFSRPDSYFLRLNCNTTTEKLADPAKRAEIVEFVRHVILAADRIALEPELGAEFLARMSGFDPGLVLRCMGTLDFVARIEPDQLDVLVEQEAWVAAEQGRAARSRAELATLIDTSVYEEAVAGLDPV